MSDAPWTIEYENDTGPDDEGFLEWYQVGPARIDIPAHDEEGRKRAKEAARLIQHAPEMAEALQMWSDYHNSADDVSMMIRYAEALEATMTLLSRIRRDAA